MKKEKEPNVITQLRESSKRSSDKRTWAEVTKEFPQVRTLLSTTKRLFLESAKGASEGRTWHNSLCYLSKLTWNGEESQAIMTLILNFLNEDFTS